MDTLKYKLQFEYFNENNQPVTCEHSISSDGTAEFSLHSKDFHFSKTAFNKNITYGFVKQGNDEYEFRIKYDKDGELDIINNLSSQFELGDVLAKFQEARLSSEVRLAHHLLKLLKQNKFANLKRLSYYCKELIYKQKKPITYSVSEKAATAQKRGFVPESKEVFYKYGKDGVIEQIQEASGEHFVFMHILNQQYETTIDEYNSYKDMSKVPVIVKRAESIKKKAMSLEPLLADEKSIDSKLLAEFIAVPSSASQKD